MNKKPKMPAKSFAQIQADWQLIQSLAPRDKLKALKQIGFDVMISYESGDITLEKLELYSQILQQAVRAHSFPQRYARILSKMIADKLALTNSEPVTILAKASGKIMLSGATVMVGDPSIQTAPLIDYSDNELLALINLGQRFLFATGSDGVFDMQLRIIEANTPVLTAQEYKCVENSGQTAIISAPSGKIVITALGEIDDKDNQILQEIAPGNYKITVFVFNIPKKMRSYYIVLCKTAEPAVNHLERIDMLE